MKQQYCIEEPDVLGSQMPALDQVVSYHKKKCHNVDTTIVVCLCHTLYTIMNLLQALIDHGFLPCNIFFIGKHYSMCDQVAQKIKALGIRYFETEINLKLGEFQQSYEKDLGRLWDSVSVYVEKNQSIDKLVLLDHGGHALKTMPKEKLTQVDMVVVENTNYGLIRYDGMLNLSTPLISVASSAAKTVIESPMIGEEIVKRLLEIVDVSPNSLCGVVGNGNIGSNVCELLRRRGFEVVVFDISRESNCSFFQFVSKCDILFGCTGVDISTDTDAFLNQQSPITLVSCSSADIEYNSLLKVAQERSEYLSGDVCASDDIEIQSKNKSVIKILRGGFPINFDSSGYCVSAQYIQLTRALVFCATVQAMNILFDQSDLENCTVRYLSKELQLLVVSCLNFPIDCGRMDKFYSGLAQQGE